MISTELKIAVAVIGGATVIGAALGAGNGLSQNPPKADGLGRKDLSDVLVASAAFGGIGAAGGLMFTTSAGFATMRPIMAGTLVAGIAAAAAGAAFVLADRLLD